MPLAGPPPSARRGRDVWLSRSCLSVRHRFGPDGGDGAPGIGLIAPARAGVEVPGDRERPGLRAAAGVGVSEGLERPTTGDGRRRLGPAGLTGALRRGPGGLGARSWRGRRLRAGAGDRGLV